MTMFWWVVESSVRLTLLAGLVAVVMWALRVTSAEARLRAWSAVIAASFVLPWLPDQWLVPDVLSLAAPVSSPLSVSSPGVAVAPSHSTPAGLLPAVDALTVMVLVYAVGVVALLTRLALGWTWARRLLRDAVPVAGQSFSESPLVHVPVTVGLLRPAIIVPDTWRTWPADTLDAVLAHERAHASRLDGLWLTVALLHRALHWINPLSWWLARHMASLSEAASDDAALSKGVAPTRYAEIVLGFATAVATRQQRVAWVVAMARPAGRDTERRLDRVLTWKGRAVMSRSRVCVLAFVLMSGSAAVYTAGVTPEAPPLEAAVQAVGEPVKTSPTIRSRVNPKYTPDARRARVQGIVEMEIEIDTAGAVAAAKVIKSLDTNFGLDEEALRTVRLWSFRPATVDGKPVPFTAVVQMEFRLRDEPNTEQQEAQKAAQKPEPVVVAPVVIKRVDPKYTAAAMGAKIQGKVKISAVVNIRGEVVEARIIESLDAELGLDASALTAASQWRYEPARHNGKVVAATVVIEMEFRLH